MPVLRFVGRIFPDELKIDLEPFTTSWANRSLDIQGDFELAIRGRDVSVTCNLNQFERHKHFFSIFTRVHDITRTFLDLFTFSHGMPVTLIFDRIESPDGLGGPIVIRDESVIPDASAIKSESDFSRAFSFLINNPELQLAIRDLAESLSSLYVAPINCARAVEAVRNQFIPPGGDREDGWEPMRRSLNLSKPYLKTITDGSRGPRHGADRRIMGDPLRTIGYRSWTVMNRFIEYKKRGSQELPLDEFPLLD